MTANAMAGDRDRVISAGMDDHIAKPLNVHEMFATLARWITPVHPGFTMPAQEPAEAGDRKLPDLPGIDTVAGLERTLQNRDLYLRQLRKFRQSQGHFDEAFARARQDNDLLTLTRLAHTLKGTAGNIGAGALQAAAQTLETACSNGTTEEMEMRRQETLRELVPVLQGLAALGEETTGFPETAETVAPPAEDIAARLDTLRALLAQSDCAAVDLVEALLPRVAGTPLAGQLARVAREIEVFDFDAALVALPPAPSV